MYHSITIGTKNTWDDWHLIPASRPLFNPPSVKTNYIEIPGADGSLDVTTAIAGRPLFNNRTGSWSFYVENGYKEWSILYSEIMMYLHGQEMTAVLEDDPAYFYVGRFSVNQWRSDPGHSMIVINYNVDPYKYYSASDENWLWDPFNFETGYIRYYKNLVVTNTLTVNVVGDVMETIPTIVCSTNTVSVTFKGVTHQLTRGNNKFNDFIVSGEDNEFVFTGNGTISIDAVGGRL